MAMWAQHLVVFAAVAGCVGVVATQAVRTLRGRKGAIGSCCAKGCDATGSEAKVVFLPVEMLKRRKT